MILPPEIEQQVLDAAKQHTENIAGDSMNTASFLDGAEFGAELILKKILADLKSEEARNLLTQFESDTIADWLEAKCKSK